MDPAIAGWTDFFLGAAGAAAALAGLLFVAMSINVREIVRTAGLPARAGETLVFVVGPLVASLLVLMPDQSVRAVGAEVLVVGLLAWLLTVVLQVKVTRAAHDAPVGQRATSLVTSQVATVGAVVGGAIVVTGNEDGLYVLAVGIVLSFVAAVMSGWVLLVEILR